MNKKQNISFDLVVDNFGVEYMNIQNMNHLIDALELE